MPTEWRTAIRAAEKRFERYHQTVDSIVRRYRSERSDALAEAFRARRYNLFWSNVSTLQPAIYSRQPTPVVERRYRDPDPVGRLSAELLERVLLLQLPLSRFDEAMRLARDDYLLSGRGVVWVRYAPEIVDDVVVHERVSVDYIDRRDFLHAPARRWDEVTWVGKRVYLTEAQFRAFFGADLAEGVSLAGRVRDDESGFVEAKTPVWEVWDREERKVRWVSCQGDRDVLREEPDPLGLQEFFPCAKPLYATCTPDSLVPIPDYEMYRDQLVEIDTLTDRMSDLVRSISACGVYDAAISGLEHVLQGGNRLIPVENWRSIVESGGLDGAISWMPIKPFVDALQVLQAMRQAKIQEVYDITGIADIIRGQSSPSETATAQQIKGQFATLRLSYRQQLMQQFARDTMAIMGEIIAEHFSDEAILAAGGVSGDPRFTELAGSALALLRSDFARNYRVSIETDSTLIVDEHTEKARRIEWLTSMGSFIRDAFSLAQGLPELTTALTEMILFVTRAFRSGRTMESSLELAFQATQERMQQRLAAPEGPPPPDPRLVEVESKRQLEEQRLQLEATVRRHEAELALQRLQLEAATKQRDVELEQQRLQLELRRLEQESALAAQRLQAEQMVQTERLRMEATAAATRPPDAPTPHDPPVTVNVVLPSGRRRVARMVTDEATGEVTAVIDDVSDSVEVVDGG